jgi:hypothetical protein
MFPLRIIPKDGLPLIASRGDMAPGPAQFTRNGLAISAPSCLELSLSLPAACESVH